MRTANDNGNEGGGYENAPATRMLATHCAACGRPLVDSVSVEASMGPDCRNKYGCADAVDDARREQANRIIYEIATGRDRATIAWRAEELRELGLPKLAEKVLERCCKVRIYVEGNTLLVETPYSEAAVARMRAIPGRRWDKERKVNTFPTSSRAALFAALKDLFPHEVAVGPKGAFIL